MVIKCVGFSEKIIFGIFIADLVAVFKKLHVNMRFIIAGIAGIKGITTYKYEFLW